MRTREEYENEIDSYLVVKTTKTEIFHSLGLQTEFFTLLTDYYRFYVYPRKSLDSYDMQLMETAVKCIKYYDENRGSFLHLFNFEMKKAIRKAEAEARRDRKRQGLKINRIDERLIGKITAIGFSRNLDVYDAADRRKIAVLLGTSVEEIENAVFLDAAAVVVPSRVRSDDRSETELFDLLPCKDESEEEKTAGKEAADDFLKLIDCVFEKVQCRQKRLLSMLMTARIVKDFDYDTDKVIEILSDRKIFSREIIDYFAENGELPTAKQIGDMCGLSEQSVSRAYKTFREKIKVHI